MFHASFSWSGPRLPKGTVKNTVKQWYVCLWLGQSHFHFHFGVWKLGGSQRWIECVGDIRGLPLITYAPRGRGGFKSPIHFHIISLKPYWKRPWFAFIPCRPVKSKGQGPQEYCEAVVCMPLIRAEPLSLSLWCLEAWRVTAMNRMRWRY